MTQRVTPTFEISRWRSRYVPTSDGVVYAPFVVGPYGACEIEYLRGRLAGLFDIGPAVPTDVIIFGLGDSKDRSHTKVGGLPFLRRDDPWPTGQVGQPLPFLAQFDFRQSLDHVGHLVQGDLLLVFGDNSLSGPAPEADLSTVWVDVGDSSNVVTERDVPVLPSFDPCYGRSWRTLNYPKTRETVPYELITLDPDRLEVELADPHNPFLIHATQISTAPHVINLIPDLEGGELLCSLYSVIPMPWENEFPFLNHNEAIEYDEIHNRYASSFRFLELGNPDRGHTIYFYMTKSHNLEWFVSYD